METCHRCQYPWWFQLWTLTGIGWILNYRPLKFVLIFQQEALPFLWWVNQSKLGRSVAYDWKWWEKPLLLGGNLIWPAIRNFTLDRSRVSDYIQKSKTSGFALQRFKVTPPFDVPQSKPWGQWTPWEPQTSIGLHRIFHSIHDATNLLQEKAAITTPCWVPTLTGYFVGAFDLKHVCSFHSLGTL